MALSPLLLLDLIPLKKDVKELQMKQAASNEHIPVPTQDDHFNSHAEEIK